MQVPASQLSTLAFPPYFFPNDDGYRQLARGNQIGQPNRSFGFKS